MSVFDPGIPDTFCTNLVKVEPIGSGVNVRLVFAVPQDCGREDPENVVVARLIIPAEELAAMAEALLKRRAASVPGVERRPLNSGGQVPASASLEVR